MTVALTIAGADPSGGAGIQADLKTFQRFGVYGEAVITLIAVQNTRGVSLVECLSPSLVEAQIRAVLDDIPPAAVKTGAVGNSEIIDVVCRCTAELGAPLIVDPVMFSKNGSALLDPCAITALRERLLPRAWLITPNLQEAAVLANCKVQSEDDMRHAAELLVGMGARAALVKGGHLRDSATDVLFDGCAVHEFPAPRIGTASKHGTGCAYSAAITALIANGVGLRDAIQQAKQFMAEAIRDAPYLGSGAGPLKF